MGGDGAEGSLAAVGMPAARAGTTPADWGLPRDRADACDPLLQLWRRAEPERVEVGCSGGQGRTGTAPACLAIFDGVPPADAVGYVRRHYHPRAVETPWQRRYVTRFHR